MIMAVARRPDDRRCTHVDPETGVRCITRLCRANPGPECFAHWPVSRVPSPVELRRAAVAEFERLMGQTEHGGRIAA